jgi:hypothetical protein
MPPTLIMLRTGTQTSSVSPGRPRSPLKIGTRLAFVARFLGRTLSYTYEVIDFIRNERLIMLRPKGRSG